MSMKTLEYFNLHLIVDTKLYAESLKRSLEDILEEGTRVQMFTNKEVYIDEIKKIDHKPDVIVLDYSLNKVSKENMDYLHTMDRIKQISPKSVIIILSNEEDMEAAKKTLQYGATDYILKDQFAFSHIAASVKNACIHPRFNL